MLPAQSCPIASPQHRSACAAPSAPAGGPAAPLRWRARGSGGCGRESGRPGKPIRMTLVPAPAEQNPLLPSRERKREQTLHLTTGGKARFRHLGHHHAASRLAHAKAGATRPRTARQIRPNARLTSQQRLVKCWHKHAIINRELRRRAQQCNAGVTGRAARHFRYRPARQT